MDSHSTQSGVISASMKFCLCSERVGWMGCIVPTAAGGVREMAVYMEPGER